MNQVIDWQAKQAAQYSAAQALQATHPHLVGGNSYVTAAKNMRTELKRAFPGIKFSVQSKSYSGGCSITVYWTDGPTSKAVESIINKYSGGSFDGMIDLYEYKHSAWTDAFGSAKYVFATRRYSDAMIQQVITEVCTRLDGMDSIPTLTDYNQGRLWQFKQSGGCDVEREINLALSDHSFPQ